MQHGFVACNHSQQDDINLFCSRRSSKIDPLLIISLPSLDLCTYLFVCSRISLFTTTRRNRRVVQLAAKIPVDVISCCTLLQDYQKTRKQRKRKRRAKVICHFRNIYCNRNCISHIRYEIVKRTLLPATTDPDQCLRKKQKGKFIYARLETQIRF